MNKTGLAALAALLGAGLITTKTFKSSYASETFMAQGKRAVALRAGKINSEGLQDEYYDQWRSTRNEIIRDFGSNNDVTPQQIQSVLNQPPLSAMGGIYGRWNYGDTLVQINNSFYQAFAKHYATKINRAENDLLASLQKINKVMADSMTQKSGNGLSQQEFLDSKAGKDALEEFKQTILAIKRTFLPKFSINYYSFDTIQYIDNDTELEGVLQSLTGRTYGKMNNYHVEQAINTINSYRQQNPKQNFILAPPLIKTTHFSIMEVKADSQEIKILKDYLVENHFTSMYAIILGYNEFFKANPQIKGVSNKGYDEKYYPVAFGYGSDKTHPPKTAESSQNVWDTDLFSQFTQAEFEDLLEDSKDLMENKLDELAKEVIRKDKKRGRLANRIESEQNEILKRELEAVFSTYDSLDDVEKSKMVKAYLADVLNLPYSDGGNFQHNKLVIDIEDFPMIERVNPYYVAQEPKIVRETIHWRQFSPMIKERGIEISVPASLKADAKKSFEGAIADKIEVQEETIATAQTKIENFKDDLQEGLKRF